MTSNKDFDGRTLGSDVAAAFPDRIAGRTFVITGVSPKSLGGALAVNLAYHRPGKLILASRSKKNLEDVANTIRAQTNQSVHLVVLDLADFESIRDAASQIKELTDEIHVLVNSAATVTSDRRLTKDGIEVQLGIVIGHFMLTDLLLPQVKAASFNTTDSGSVRIINISSAGHVISPVRFHDYNFEGKVVPEEEQPAMSRKRFLPTSEEPYSTFAAYGQAKTANILHSVSLNKKLDSHAIRSYALHPGSIQTDLSRNLSAPDKELVDSTSENWITPDQGTATMLVAALDPALDSHHDSIYLSDCQLTDAAGHAADPVVAEKFWYLCVHLTSNGHAKERL